MARCDVCHVIPLYLATVAKRPWPQVLDVGPRLCMWLAGWSTTSVTLQISITNRRMGSGINHPNLFSHSVHLSYVQGRGNNTAKLLIKRNKIIKNYFPQKIIIKNYHPPVGAHCWCFVILPWKVPRILPVGPAHVHSIERQVAGGGYHCSRSEDVVAGPTKSKRQRGWLT